jgi:hypothetical protein
VGNGKASEGAAIAVRAAVGKAERGLLSSIVTADSRALPETDVAVGDWKLDGIFRNEGKLL